MSGHSTNFSPTWHRKRRRGIPKRRAGCPGLCLLAVAVLDMLVLSTVSGPGCTRSPSHSTSKNRKGSKAGHPDSEALASAQELVQAFFKAVEDEDCRLIVDTMTSGATMADCEEFVREWKGHGMKLLAIVEAKPDGRNPKAVIVRTRVKGKRGPKTTLVRVVRHKGHWAVKL